MSDPGTTPAERYAALTALKAGLEDQIAKAKNDLLAVAQVVGVKAFTTPWGQVNVTRNDAKVIITDEAAFTAWVKQHRPDEVETIEQVRASYRKAVLEDQLVVVKGEVVDTKTGEVVTFAALSEPGDPYPAYPSSKEQRQAKAWAKELFADRAQALTSGLRELTDGEL